MSSKGKKMSVEKRRLQISWTDLQFFRSENVSILLSGIDSKGRLGETAIWEIGKKLRFLWNRTELNSLHDKKRELIYVLEIP